MTGLPDSLTRFGEQLERAIEREGAARGRRRRVAVRMAAATAAAGAIVAGVASLPGDGTTGVVPGPATAAAAERAAAVLSPAAGGIVHDVAVYRALGADGSVSTWREETWRQTSRPYARRQVVTRPGGAPVETTTTGDGATDLYDPATNVIYTHPAGDGPALGTPMAAGDGDPLAEQMSGLLRSGKAQAVSRSTAGGRRVIRFAYENALPGGGAVRWTYVVDAETYRPVELTSASPDGSRVTTRFETYETLDATADTRALLSLAAQHPGATVDGSEAGYRAAASRLAAGAVAP